MQYLKLIGPGLLALVIIGTSPVRAQQSVLPCQQITSPAGALGCIPASGANPLPVTAGGSTTTELTGTITLTGTYQQVFPASFARRGCLIQVKGTHAMLVFFGATKPADNSGAGYSLEASDAGVDGGSISCGLIGGGYATDAVWIEGTTNDTFEYSSQP